MKTFDQIESFGDYDFKGFYELMVRHAPPGSVLVEVGCFKGRSLCHLATIAKEANKGLKVIGVDWGRGMGDNYSDMTANDLIRNLVDCGMDRDVHLIMNSSYDAPYLVKNLDPWMVFLDGLHTPHEAVRDEILNWYPVVKDHGFLCGHDYRWHTVCEPVNAILGNVYHDPEWDNVWMHPKGLSGFNSNAIIRNQTTIPKNPSLPSIREYMEIKSSQNECMVKLF